VVRHDEQQVRARGDPGHDRGAPNRTIPTKAGTKGPPPRTVVRLVGRPAGLNGALRRLGQANVHGLEALGSFLKIELDRLALFE
jgi:hypothetical protein